MHARSLIALSVSLLSICLLQLRAQDSPDAVAIRGLEAKWAEAYKERRFDVLSSLLADDFVITCEDGSVYSKVGLISQTAQPNMHVEISEFSDLKIKVHGDMAVVTGNYHERGESGTKHYEYNDRFTDVWTKSQSRWQLMASHYSVPAH